MPEVPDNVTEIGFIRVSSVLTESGGTHTAFGLSGIGAEEAIGRLTVVIDRLREGVAASWSGDFQPEDFECPNCGESLFPDDTEDEDE